MTVVLLIHKFVDIIVYTGCIMGWESFRVVRFDLGFLLQGQTRTAKLQSVYNLLIVGPRGLQCETNVQEIMGWESSDVVRFDLEPLLEGKMSTA